MPNRKQTQRHLADLKRQQLIGQIAVNGDAIESMSGGVSLVRRLTPGDMATKDFRVDA